MDSVAERGKKRPRQRGALSFFFPVLSLLGKVSPGSVPPSYSTHILFDLYLIHAILARRAHAINRDACLMGRSGMLPQLNARSCDAFPRRRVISGISIHAGI